jgi:hypothetical protein
VIVQTSTAASNGPGPLPTGVRDAKVRYPATFVPSAQFDRVIERSYSIDLRVVEGRDAHVGRDFAIDMVGYLLRRLEPS